MRTVLQATLMVVLVATAFAGVACQQAPAPEPETEAAAAPTDEELLHELAAAFAETWGNGDAAGLSGFWTEGGDTLTAEGHFVGRAAVQDYYTQAFAGPYAGTSIAIQMTDVRFLKPDVAVADGTYVVTGAKGPEGEELPALEGQWTNVNVKVGGKWLIASSRPMVPVERPEGDES
jgi:uncharacterized protein (TIGR02246 family)